MKPVKTIGLVVALLILARWIPAFTIGDVEFRRSDILSQLFPKAETDDLAALPEVPEVPQPKRSKLDAPLSSDSLTMADSALSGSPPSTPSRPLAVSQLQTSNVFGFADYGDSTGCGLRPFFEALDRAGSRPVRIAYFGDSYIEGDILTADIRALLQAQYGGGGVGYVEPATPLRTSRSSVSLTFDGLTHYDARPGATYHAPYLGLAQSYAEAYSGGWTEQQGSKDYPGLDTCQMATLYYQTSTPMTLHATINGGERVDTFEAVVSGRVEALRVEGHIGRIRWNIDNAEDGALLFGVALENRTGIVLDNFSLRGSRGTQIASIPMEHLQRMNRLRPYDLIVLQYGLNIAEKDRLDYSGYNKQMRQTIEHLKAAFPNAGILIVSVGDREGKDEEGALRTFPGVKALVRYQQILAIETGVAFWNLYEAMGGEGSVVAMAEQNPPEANKDYTHINRRGGKTLGALFVRSLIQEKSLY